MRFCLCFAVVFVLPTSSASGQQVADTSFAPAVSDPAYPAESGPTVLIDEAHFNFHTAGGRYLPFAWLLRRDGYVVRASAARFSGEALQGADILVISNAIAEKNQEDWSLPTAQAFDSEEITAVRDWVAEGGSLMLIADHMPFPGSAENLAAAFGLLFSNGFAIDAEDDSGRIVFRRIDGTLADHPITRGRNPSERVDSVLTFMGQAFRTEGDVEPLMVMPRGSMMLLPEVAWWRSRNVQRSVVGAGGCSDGNERSRGRSERSVPAQRSSLAFR
jgi:hypothetical protein